jgi:transcriptional regulator with XRE-family HTH domain
MTLSERRLNLGLSVAALARKAEVEPHVIRHAEKSGTRPRPENALKLAQFYGEAVTDLWPVETPKAAAA